MVPLLITSALIVILILYHNRLVLRKNKVDNATGSINATLNIRHNLIPHLVDTVKVYMSYESDVLNKLTALRIKAISEDTTVEEKLQINSKITSTLGRIMVAVENYPQLKNNNSFLQLQENWTDIEDCISTSRRFYNNAVADYNSAIQSFPGNILSLMMEYKKKMIFEVTREETFHPKVKNLFSN